mmetsp:Transcript_85715/g.242744  ORF Transcript_85715/g.242744 Transcript_85715/m.242744 type:complete len:252 (-) Transcript_85715:2051-2806(-)
MSRRSPKSCVASFAYGVSPQPSHAPLNSRSGWLNCEPLMENLSNLPALSGSDMAKFQLSACPPATTSSMLAIFRALSGHVVTHTSQPVQSMGEAWMRKLRPAIWWPPVALRTSQLPGAFLSSSFEARKGRITAWGQMAAHLLHCVHLSRSTTGTLAATPRFAHCVMPSLTTPPASNLLTGMESPSRQWILSSTSPTSAGTSGPRTLESTGTATSPGSGACQSAGRSILCSSLSDMSMAVMFFRTTSGPLLL